MNIARNLAIAAFTAVVAMSWGATAKLCLDPGHGGSDPGAVGCGQNEDTNNLNTYLKFRNWLNADTGDGAGGGSWTVIMTRSTDVAVSLSSRVAISNNNGCNRFMSVHNNACGSCGASGSETFSYTSGSSTSHALRNAVQYRTIQAWGLPNRGNKVANFYVIKYTNAPAELCELGFIDKCSPDAAYLGNSTHQDTMGKYHLFAIQTHYGLAAYTPNSGATYTVDNANSGFSCSANWSTGSSSTDKYGSNYRFRPTEAISDSANFAASVSTGSYAVYAWWPAGSNRSSAAPYILPSGASVKVNQQVNGGKWNTLATGQSLSGTATTKLSCWAATGYVVVADAVRYVR